MFSSGLSTGTWALQLGVGSSCSISSSVSSKEPELNELFLEGSLSAVAGALGGARGVLGPVMRLDSVLRSRAIWELESRKSCHSRSGEDF